jgi:anti-sigma B factor antagonist
MFRVAQQGAVRMIQGEVPLNGDYVDMAARCCEPLCSLGQPKLVFDLSGIPLINSAGLELLLDVRDRCAARGGALVLAAPTPLCREILSATGLLGGIAVFDDAVSAAGSFAQ